MSPRTKAKCAKPCAKPCEKAAPERKPVERLSIPLPPAKPEIQTPTPEDKAAAPPPAPPKPPFLGSPLCTGHTHCVECLDGTKFRESLKNSFVMPDDKFDFECPQKITPEEALELRAAHQAVESSTPSLYLKARAAAKAAGTVVKNIVHGWEIEVDRPVFLSRLIQCKVCPSDQYHADDGKCAKTGNEVARDAALEKGACPLNFWRPHFQPMEIDERTFTANLLFVWREELAALLPADGATMVAFGKFDKEVGTANCQGCAKRRLQAEALQAFVKEAPTLAPEVLAKVRELLKAYERVFDGPRPRPLGEVLGKA